MGWKVVKGAGRNAEPAKGLAVDMAITGLKNAYRRAYSGLPKEVWFLAIVVLINRSGSMVLPFLALYVHEELGFSPESASLIIGVYGLGSSIGTYLGDIATSRWGAIRVQIFSLSANALGFVLLSQMTSYVAFALALLVLSIVADMFRPANSVAITELTAPEHHRRAFTLNRLAINLGFTIGPAVGGILATFSYQWLFWIDALTCLLAAIAMVKLLGRRSTPSHVEAVSTQASPTRSPWFHPAFLCFLGFTLVTYAVFFQLMATYPLFLKEEYGLREWHIGLLFGLNTLLVVAFEMLLVDWLSGVSPIRLIAWGSLLMIEGFSMLAFGGGLEYAILSAIVYTVGEMLAMPQSMAYVASLGNAQTRGRYVGAFTTTISIAFVCGPLIGSYCYGIDHHLFWWITMPIGFLVLMGIPRFSPRPLPPSAVIVSSTGT
ncbi:MAG: MFS transporter [Pirellulales bacterium]